MYTAQPSHLNPINLCSITTNKKTLNRIFTFICKIIFRVQSGPKAKGNKVPSIKPTQLTKPGAYSTLALICFISSSSGHLRTFSCSFHNSARCLHHTIIHGSFGYSHSSTNHLERFRLVYLEFSTS